MSSMIKECADRMATKFDEIAKSKGKMDAKAYLISFSLLGLLNNSSLYVIHAVSHSLFLLDNSAFSQWTSLLVAHLA